MKIFYPLALTLSVFSVSSALPVASIGGLDGLLQPLTGGLGGVAAPVAESTSSLPVVNGVTNPPTGLFKKRSGNHMNDILDAIVSVNSKIVVKALAKLKLDVCSDIHAKIKVVATGLLTLDADVVVPKISARIEETTNAAVNTKIDLDTKVLVLDNIRGHGRDVILKHCPHVDDACIRKNAKKIVSGIEALVQLDVQHLFVALKVNLMTHVRAKVEVVIRDLGINLLVEQIHVVGFVDAVADVDLHLDVCAHVIVKGLHVTVLADALGAILAICAAV